MTYELAIGDKTYSSWSLRGWLLFTKFNHDVRIHNARMYTDEFKRLIAQFAPTKLVPAAKLDGAVLWDSLAIAEELNQRHPDANMWPSNPAARAYARSMTAEMHAGFGPLRSDCTMNLRKCYPDFKPSEQVLADVARINELWSHARREFGADGPWLFGQYSIADVFYAPVATRFATYDLPRSETADTYINTHLTDQKFRMWRAMGIAQNYVQPGYDLDLPNVEWPGPKPLVAKAIETGTPENSNCPYSGDPVTHFLEIDGRIFGFCNAFCRDKTIADPEAWTNFIKIYQN
ncbi:glutathione S-transferase [Amylibacter ulvae]|uniref:Glutathione S-transferase n=1 Tax=Paramylibacter ulvae TaxID=1651968 RepID=A0ABQ3D0M3_9RHOB|nr:glutathione S-transferase [Amylibacter ulvae]GHA50236.1 glutathione S-transferase [Amylibacter ulvae]